KQKDDHGESESNTQRRNARLFNQRYHRRIVRFHVNVVPTRSIGATTRPKDCHVVYFSRQPFSWLSFLFEVVKSKNGMSLFVRTLARFRLNLARFFCLDLGA